MKTLLFVVNSKQKKFFAQIKNHMGSDTVLVESKRLLIPSLKALRYLPKADLSAPVALKRDDFLAKRGRWLPAWLLEPVFRLEAAWNFLRYFRVITPEYGQLMVWNGILFRQAIAVEIAKLHGMRVVYAETGLLPGRITVDPKGVNYYNSAPRERHFFEAYRCDKPLPGTLIPRNPKNAGKFASARKIALPERYVFIPFQVDYDTQILTHSPWIRDMRMLFDQIEAISREVPELHFLFKEHPSSIKSYPDLHARAERSERLMFANAWPTQKLIEKSVAVITVNSTVGIESLLFHKRVVVLGNAFYAIDGITKRARNREELLERMQDLSQWKPDTSLIDNFLKYLYYEYQIEGSMDQIPQKGLEKIAAILNRSE